MKKLLLASLFLIISTSNLWADEKLIYATRYQNRPNDPRNPVTKIYSIDPSGGENRLIFSDESLPILSAIHAWPAVHLVTSKNRIFAYALERNAPTSVFDLGGQKGFICELLADGSNNYRKICDVIGEQFLHEIFINFAGTKIGYINYKNSYSYTERQKRKTFIFIHDTKSGKLLNQIDVSTIFLDCFAATIGWLPDGDRLFFTLDTGDIHNTSKESYPKRGSYFINADGTGLVKIPDKLILQLLGEKLSIYKSPPYFKGVLPDGTYIFSDFKWAQSGKGAVHFIYSVNPNTKSKKENSLKLIKGRLLYKFNLSNSGKYISYIEEIDEYHKDWMHNREIENLWVKNLASGEEKSVFSLDNTNVPFLRYHLSLVGWIEN